MKAILVGWAILMFSAVVLAGPTGGVLRFEGRGAAQAPPGNPGLYTLGPFEFKGGEKATVLAKGDQRPPTDVGIQIFDDRDRLVVEDHGKGDFAAVVWYPPKTGYYKVVLVNPQKEANLIYVVIK